MASGGRAARLLLLGLLLGACCGASRPGRRASKRKTLIRDIPVVKEQLAGGACNNTVQGRWLVADSEGYVCAREALSPRTQCCSGGDQFSCATCNLKSQCCAEYEHCVSCCMAPQYGAASLMREQFRAAGREESGHWETPFDFCRGKCRTTSRSTVHENAYLSPQHHCFSQSGKPSVPSPPVPDLPATVSVVAGEGGQSCAAACEAAGLACAPRHFAALNDCNRLRDAFACEAGCEAGEGAGLPGYVLPAAPKQLRPSLCQVWAAPEGGGDMGCEGAASARQRACPCAPPP